MAVGFLERTWAIKARRPVIVGGSAMVAVSLALALAAVPALADTQIGATGGNGGYCGGGEGADSGDVVLHAGVITSMSFQQDVTNGASQRLDLNVLRPNADGTYTVVGNTGLQTLSGDLALATFKVNIPVSGGEILGMYCATGVTNFVRSSNGTDTILGAGTGSGLVSDPSPSTKITFPSGLTISGESLNESANLAPTIPSPSTGLTATVAVSQQFRSVTLSSSSETFAGCTGGSSSASTLGFPNGGCATPVFTLTNSGTVPEGVDMQGGAMVPSDGGASWALVPGDPRAGPVGVDEYALGNINQIWLSTLPQLDPNAGAAMQPNATVSDDLNLVGPSASTDASPSFSTSVLYTAF